MKRLPQKLGTRKVEVDPRLRVLEISQERNPREGENPADYPSKPGR